MKNRSKFWLTAAGVAILFGLTGAAVTAVRAAWPPVRTVEFNAAGMLLCAAPDRCLVLPEGASVRIPEAVPPEDWDAFLALTYSGGRGREGEVECMIQRQTGHLDEVPDH